MTADRKANDNTTKFRAARDLLLALREDHDAAYARFRWPRFDRFNWALDWFDPIAAANPQPAVSVVNGATVTVASYAQLAQRSNRVGNWLRARGVRRGDRLLVMLGNQIELWEVLLAAMKLGAVVIPANTTISAPDLTDRIRRGAATHLITTDALAERMGGNPARLARIVVGNPVRGWLPYADTCVESADFAPDGPTHADDPLLLYFTSGTTSRPKIAVHTHVSYPVGHLSGMYFNGVRPGDLHLNISAPGWAKHAWSSFFVPFNAEASLLTVGVGQESPRAVLDALSGLRPTTCCAPPTVWRTLAREDLRSWPVALREAASVGEPLHPDVIERIRQAWGITVRDGYGQSETTAQIGNSPGLPVRPGALGKVLPGYRVELVDPRTGNPGDEGEICVDLSDRPVGMMTGYLDDEENNDGVFAGSRYHTGDIGRRDADGYITYVGRADDVFKCDDHRISPFELESVLLGHPDVVEAAVVGVPDPVGLQVPKAFVTLASGRTPSADTARRILVYARGQLAPHQWIRRLEFGALPKTTSGKIRRAELRAMGFARAGRRQVAGRLGEYICDELLGSRGAHSTGPPIVRTALPSTSDAKSSAFGDVYGA